MKYTPLILLLIIAGCAKNNTTPDITTGLTVDIALDGSAYEAISQTTGTIYKATAATNRHGEAGKAMQFNRADSAYIDFGDLANASFTGNVFTMVCWVNVTDTISPAQATFSKRGIYGPFEYSLDNFFNRAAYTLDNWNDAGSVYGIDPLKAEAAISPNTWQHVAYVADGNLLKVYLNGVLQTGTDTHTGDFVFNDTDAHLVIGNGGGWGKTYFFNGKIDDIRMYNKALSASTIKYLAGL